MKECIKCGKKFDGDTCPVCSPKPEDKIKKEDLYGKDAVEWLKEMFGFGG